MTSDEKVPGKTSLLLWIPLSPSKDQRRLIMCVVPTSALSQLRRAQKVIDKVKCPQLRVY